MGVNVSGRHAAKLVAANCYVVQRDGKDIGQLSFIRPPAHTATVVRRLCEALDEEAAT